MKGIFITGTDTNVGKTYIGCLLARQLHNRGVNVIPRKPIESGCRMEDGELIPADALALKKASDYTGSLAQVCPFRFEPAISPLRAARIANQTLLTHKVTEACLSGFACGFATSKDFLLVEGAGGFYSPICEDGLNADLAQALGLPVLLVAEDRLGCINQVLLTLEAIQSKGLTTKAIVLNRLNPQLDFSSMENFEELQKLTNTPIETLQFSAETGQAQLDSRLVKDISG